MNGTPNFHTTTAPPYTPTELRKRTHSTYTEYSTDTSGSGANDNTMHEISNLLQTIHSDELNEVYGGSVWNSISSPAFANHYVQSAAEYDTNNTTNTAYDANAVYGGSVWNSISTNPSNTYSHTNLHTHTATHTNTHTTKNDNDSDSEIQELVLQGIIRWNDKLVSF